MLSDFRGLKVGSAMAEGFGVLYGTLQGNRLYLMFMGITLWCHQTWLENRPGMEVIARKITDKSSIFHCNVWLAGVNIPMTLWEPDHHNYGKSPFLRGKSSIHGHVLFGFIGLPEASRNPWRAMTMAVWRQLLYMLTDRQVGRCMGKWIERYFRTHTHIY